jgi:hypothetical protein
MERITAELREYFGDCYLFRYGDVRERLTAIADRIDAAHQKAEDEWKAKDGQTWLRGYGECHAELMEGNEVIAADLERAGWLKLPVDADGEYIRIRDELRDEWNELNQGKVEWLMLDHRGWWLKLNTSCERFYVHVFHEWHHHHAPTVEDVLREFVERWHDTHHDDLPALFAEYAARLRLAGDE